MLESWSKIRVGAVGGVWTHERSRKLDMLLQKSFRGYMKTTGALVTKILASSTRVAFKAFISLVFSFVVFWDLPRIANGVQSLSKSRVAFAYREIAPVIMNISSVVGRSFEAQVPLCS